MRAILTVILSIFPTTLLSGAPLAAGTASANPGTDHVRYLVPITSHRVAGAHGSLWTSELALHNASTSTVHLQPQACPPITVPPFMPWPCVLPLSAGETRILTFEPRTDRGEGAFVYVPRALAAAVDFQLRVRDLSREDEGWGAELPVVPLDDSHGGHDQVRLIHIPIDARYRVMLRVYSSLEEPRQVLVKVRALSDNRVLEERLVTLEGIVTVDPVGFPLRPAYAQLDPLSQPVLASGETAVNLVIEPSPAIFDPPASESPIWAVASVTNNVTQEVTVVTPHRP